MDKKYLYLTLNVCSVIVPLLFSFYPKANFSKKWKYVLPAITVTAIIFLVWDEFFTQLGVWGFNEEYLTGIKLFSLPLEEVLFFFCIPYASYFIYFALNYLVERDYFYPHHEIISSLIIFFTLLLGGYFMDEAYTSATFFFLGLFLAYQMLKLRPRYMGRFYFAYLFILIPFFIVNGVLTGSWIDEPVVWYNNNENMGIRLGTIPAEDVFYGMLMMVMSITIAEELEHRKIY